MPPKQKTTVRGVLWLFIAQLTLHGIILLLQPNGVSGDSWLGYSSSRFLLLVFSFLLAAGLFLLRERAWLYDKASAFVDDGLGGCLLAFGLLISSAVVAVGLLFPLGVWAKNTQALLLYLRPTLVLMFFLSIEAATLAIALAKVAKPQKIYWSLAFGVLSAYTLLRIYSYLQLDDPYTTADSAAYTGFSSLAEMLVRANFWSGPRPFVVPLLGTLVGQSLVYFVWVQTAVSLFCWGFLAVSLADQFRSAVMKTAVLASVLAFSLGRHILVWDWSIMSESLSLSLMALLVGLFVRLGESFTWVRAILIVLVSFLWAFTRDANAWVILLASAFILLAFFVRKLDEQWAALSAALMLVFVLNSISVNSAPVPRWSYPLMHAIIVDVLPHDKAVAYFVERGMPFTEEMSGWPAAFPLRLNLAEEDDLDDFYRWTVSGGRSVYLGYLLSTMPGSLLTPMAGEHFPVRIGNEFNRPYAYEPPLPLQVEDVFYFDLWSVTARLLVVALMLFALWRAWSMSNRLAVVAFAMVALSYAYAFLAWYGDGLSRARHLLPAEVLLRLGCLLLVLELASYFSERLFLRKNPAGVELTAGIST